MDKILALTPVPTVVIDAGYSIRSVSASYQSLTGAKLEECLGFNIYEFVKRRAPLPRPQCVRTAIETAIATRNVHSVEDLPTQDGIYWTLRTVPIFEAGELLYVMCEVQDTTQEHMKLQTLNEEKYENETYKMLVHTVKDYAIFMLDPHGNVATWNSGAELLKGYSRDEIVGKHFSKFYGDEDMLAEKPKKELEACLRDGKVEDEGWRCRKDGSRFWANVIITAVYRDDALIGFSKVTRDLTERRAAEARLVSAYEESAKLKSEFLANMSHEIRTPMHGMLSALTLLLETPLTYDQRELAMIIQESGAVLLQVINDILDYSKLASGCFSISSDVISIPDILHSVARSLQTTLKPEVSLESSFDASVPFTAQGDPLRYRQIIQNLVGNATKFTDNGSIRAHASLMNEDEHFYTILTEVTDSGIGVAPYAVASLFTPFSQFDTSFTKKYQGTGLGLSICKSLAELMGGKIGFKPNPAGKGSVFWFTMKLVKTDKLRNVDSLEVKDHMNALGLTPNRETAQLLREIAPRKRLLLAEDNMINQKVMLKMLAGLGFDNIHTANNGVDTVALVKHSPTPYDLILMDINMPMLDGIATTVEIRAAGYTVPIVAMTANALKGAAEAFLAKGMDDYIAKPVDKSLLTSILLKWVRPPYES